MRSKQIKIMKQIQLLGLVTILGTFVVSCAHKGKATARNGNNPYQSNPYYSDSSSTASSSAGAGAAQYPAYNDTAPAVETAPATQPAPSYPSYTGDSDSYSGGSEYPSYTGSNDNSSYSSNPYPSSSSGGTTHTVATGENLYRISLRYGTTVRAIQEANGLNSDTIYAGQSLIIP